MESKHNKNSQYKAIKITSIIVALFIIIWLSATYYTGKILEKNRDKLSNNLNKIEETLLDYIKNQQLIEQSLSLPKIKLQYITYDRGIFTTTIKVGMYNDELFNEEPLLFNITLYHGPFPLNKISQLQLIPKVFSSYITLDQHQVPLILSSVMSDIEKINVNLEQSYNNNWKVRLYSPQLKYTKHNNELALGELKLIGDLKKNRLSFNLTTHSLSYNQIKTQLNNVFNMQQLNVNYLITDIFNHQQEKLQISVDKLNADINTNKMLVDTLQIELLENTEKEYYSSLLMKKIVINMFDNELLSDELLIDERLDISPSNDLYINNIKIKNIVLNQRPFGSFKWNLSGEAKHQNTQHINYSKLKDLLFNSKIAEFSYSLLKTNPKIEHLIDIENTAGKSTLYSSYIFDTTELSGIDKDDHLNQIEPFNIILTALQRAEIKLSLDKKMLKELSKNLNIEKDNEALNTITEEQFLFGINILNQYIEHKLSLIEKNSSIKNTDLEGDQTTGDDETIEFIINDKDKIISHILYEDNVFAIKNKKYHIENQ